MQTCSPFSDLILIMAKPVSRVPSFGAGVNHLIRLVNQTSYKKNLELPRIKMKVHLRVIECLDILTVQMKSPQKARHLSSADKKEYSAKKIKIEDSTIIFDSFQSLGNKRKL